jgi:ketosteroid isomerase-like protein
MSQENVDRFLAGIEAMNRRDIEAVLGLMDPEVRFEHRLAELQGNFVGTDDVRAFLMDLVAYFPTGQIHCTDIRDLGDPVLALGVNRATGKESRIETELPFTVVARFRDGRITDFTDYGDREKALEAAGLSE